MNTLVPFFTKTIPDFFMNTLVPAIMGGLQAIWNFLSGVANFIWQGLQTIADLIWKAATGFSTFMLNLIINAFSSLGKLIMDAFKTFTDVVTAIIRVPYEGIQTLTAEVAKAFLTPFITGHIKAMGISSPEFFSKELVETQTYDMFFFAGGAFLIPLLGQLPLRFLSWIGRAIGRWLYGQSFPIEIDLSPFGIGVKTKFDLAKALGASLSTSAEEVVKYSEEIGRGLVYGLSIWITRPVAYLANFLFRNIVPIRLPREDLIVEYTRRALPRDDIDDIIKVSKFYLAVQGYADWMVDMFFLSPDQYNIKVTDRFGQERKVPLALVYQLPTPSDVATMMVRDVFASFEDFQELYHARGMHPDIGALYYFLRFRYPPPERLWQFTTRGISGLLWATLPDTEKTAIQAEAKPLGAYMPTAPADLNFQADKLMSAFKTYMKWHDYARFAWVKDFASDNLIYVDTLADIPTKIDQRWLVKWGIYEFLSAKKITYQSPIWDFNVKAIEATATSNITLDLTNFCRTLQATGLHPDWVPVTAVAETMNVLSEERTLLRTGVISLFKEGFLETDAIETFLAGAITASFQVAYFDMDTLQWTTGWLNIPVMFLPPERKLIELRAMMDRALDILRDIQKDAFTAYQEYIIWDKNEFESSLSKIIDKINTIYAQDYKTITGTNLPDSLKLTYVKAYYDSYLEALKIWREVFTVRRIRMWTQRWLGWVMYRVAYGQVSPEDIDKLVDVIKEKAKLTDTEADFIEQVANIMYGIAKKTTVAEYLPTPQTMATLSEYMTLDTKLVQQVLAERGLDETWQKIWLTYITVKPIKADAKALLSTYVRALRREAIDKKTLDDFIKTLPNYGFTDKEITLIVNSIDLEEQILESREYIPTPASLATIVEIVPEAREFFDDVVKARRIPKQWQEVWAKYIDYKPIIGEVNKMLSRVESLYEYFAIDEATYQKVLDSVKYLGWTDQEIEFMLYTSRYVRWLRAYRELIGDIDRMVTISNYSPKAEEYALGNLYKMIDAMPIDDATKQTLKAMWEDYIRNRHVKDEVITYVRDLVNLYVYGQLSYTDLDKELTWLEQWGLSKYEHQFWLMIAEARKARKLGIPVAFTPE
jgi:hypothetical protein